MGLFFAPMARVTLGFAPRHLEGVASGTSSALRQLGTVMGIAALGAVFSAAGGYASGQDFVDGMRAAQLVGAVVLALAAMLALALPKDRGVAGPAVAVSSTPEPAMAA
jgi:hypothetical protein